jgi:hypothetical protein
MKGNDIMNKTTQLHSMRRNERTITTPSSGLPVRTNLRAGLAWDDLDDQAAALWSKLTGAVSSAADAVTASVTPTQS